MRVKEGDIVTFNNLPDAARFEVIRVDGFSLEVREEGGNYASQYSDTSLVAKIVDTSSTTTN